jgi:hypothetical protein
MGRWLSRDPIEEDGLNLYVMVENDIVNALDALGAAKCCINCKWVEYDPATQCCKNGTIEEKVTDGAGRKCYKDDITIVEIRVMRMLHHRGHIVGHAFIKTPKKSMRYYPAATNPWYQHLYGEGEVRDDTTTPYDESNTYTYKACPESVKKLEDSMTLGKQGTYDISNTLNKNCCGWACQKVEDAGFTAPYNPNTMGLAPKAMAGRGYGSGRE